MALNIAVDGPAGAGKSSIADEVARRLGILHLDTGAMYRAVGLRCLREGVPVTDEQAVTALCARLRVGVEHGEGGQRTLLDGEDVSALIRTPEVSKAASAVAKYAGVRTAMVAAQREMAATTDMLMDGRDIGTRVLPDAPLKVYLTAAPEERARRRYLDLAAENPGITYAEALRDLIRRDEQDMNREVDPLRPAEDSVTVDSTLLSFDEVVEKIVALAEAVRHG